MGYWDLEEDEDDVKCARVVMVGLAVLCSWGMWDR